MLSDNIKNIYRRMSHAAMKAGREPEEVKLIAVTKTVDAETIIRAVEIGLRDFGENRVQEAEQKISDIGSVISHSRVVWHLIGHLQKNKARAAVRLFDLIHSVDSAELAAELNKQAERIGKIQDILVQVNLSGEESKHGVAEDQVMPLLAMITELKHLRPRGMMTIPPYFDDPEKVRPYFRRLRELREEAGRNGFTLSELSMGMSNDFETAILEGATIVRIGTSIFGERRYK